jgi:hypothetical protein
MELSVEGVPEEYGIERNRVNTESTAGICRK